jgi:hypothetical protein
MRPSFAQHLRRLRGPFCCSYPGHCICKLGQDGQVRMQSDAPQAAHPEREQAPVSPEAAELALYAGYAWGW